MNTQPSLLHFPLNIQLLYIILSDVRTHLLTILFPAFHSGFTIVRGFCDGFMPITSPCFHKIIRGCIISIPRFRTSQSEKSWETDIHMHYLMLYCKVHESGWALIASSRAGYYFVASISELVTTSPMLILMNEPPEVCLWEDGFQLPSGARLRQGQYLGAENSSE